mgnify:CR=1 FL=1
MKSPMFIIRALMVVLSTIWWGSLSLILSFSDDTGRKQIGMARRWARSLLTIGGVKVTVEGLEKIRPDGSYVIASNHLSYMDTPVVLANIPVQFRFLAKRGLFQIPFLGTHLARAGHIPVPRDDPRAAVKTMMRRKFGRIIGITSVVGVTGNPGQANYAASKAGMIGFTKALAAEVASRNITANSIAPGFISSAMTDGLPETQKEMLLKNIPAGRLGEGADVAAAAVFLASEEAAYITGQTLHVNGGMAMI